MGDVLCETPAKDDTGDAELFLEGGSKEDEADDDCDEEDG